MIIPGSSNFQKKKPAWLTGHPFIDLHFTIQAIRNVEDFAALKKRLQEYCSKLMPF